MLALISFYFVLVQLDITNISYFQSPQNFMFPIIMQQAPTYYKIAPSFGTYRVDHNNFHTLYFSVLKSTHLTPAKWRIHMIAVHGFQQHFPITHGNASPLPTATLTCSQCRYIHTNFVIIVSQKIFAFHLIR